MMRCLDSFIKCTRVNSYINMQSWEANLFDDVEPYPYQYLQEYDQMIWRHEMQLASSNYINNNSLGHHSTLNHDHHVQSSIFEFQPFEAESTAHQAGHGAETFPEAVPEISFLPFELEQHSQMTASNLNNEEFDSEWRPSEPTNNQANLTQSKEKKNQMGISFNTTDYIVKHCFKKMLSADFKDEVEQLCENNHLSYAEFSSYWKKKFQKHLPSKHIGLTKFRKLIQPTQVTAVQVCRVFITQYLFRDYPRHVTVGVMRNKEEYLRCATKLMYISCLKRGSDIPYPAHKQ